MVRPKTILWVDDEVEGLAAHRRFLEDQGFTVAAAAHGDDALALLRRQDRKSTRLNSSHLVISYAVFCLKKKKLNPYTRATIQPIALPTAYSTRYSSTLYYMHKYPTFARSTWTTTKSSIIDFMRPPHPS